MTYPNETARVTLTTAGGTSYVQLTVYPFGGTDKAYVMVPTAKLDGTPATVAVCAHGSGGTEEQPNLARMVTLRDGMLDRGWIVASAFAHDRAWGNNQALADYENVHGWVNDIWPVTRTILHGESMGALTMALLAARGTIPTLVATVCIDGALNLAAAYAGLYTAQIKSAYGIVADGSNYATATAGHDAVLLNPASLSGQWFFVEGSTGDTQIPKVNHADVFVANMSSVLGRLDTRTGTGAHVASGNYFNTDVLSFLDDAVLRPTPAYVPIPGQPARTSKAFGRHTGIWHESLVYMWDGTAWGATG